MKPFALAGTLASDRRGIAATEFAIIAPIFVLLYLGGFDLTRALLLDQKVESAVYTIADLSSRNQKVTERDLAAITQIGDAIVAPFPASDVTFRISSLKLNGPDEPPTLEWWFSEGGARPTEAELESFAEMDATGVFLRVEAWSRYDPVGVLAFEQAVSLDAETAARSRVGDEVLCSDCPS